MQRFLCLMAVCALAAWPAGAQSFQECIVGPGSGATLLFPYFEVDTVDIGGAATLISINNSSPSSQVARVVLWTDTAIPTLAFDVYLGGLDILSLNVRDLLGGILPSTGEGADLSRFAGCESSPPSYPVPFGTERERRQLIADHTGNRGPNTGACSGSETGDGVARGYITVDVVNGCSGAELDFLVFITPRMAGYFGDGGSGLASNENVLWGDMIIVDPSEASAQGFEAIPIWADENRFSGPDTYTFYGRYHQFSGVDNRVPLNARWTQRFFNGGAFDGGASLIVWRDTGFSSLDTFTCGELPPGYPLSGTIAAIDEDAGNQVSLDPDLVGLATQRVQVSEFDIPYAFGLIRLFTAPLQSWVLPTLTAGGQFSAGYNGVGDLILCGASPPEIVEPNGLSSLEKASDRVRGRATVSEDSEPKSVHPSQGVEQ